MNKTFCIHNCQKEAPNSSWMTSRDSAKQTLQTDITITLSSTRRLHKLSNSVCIINHKSASIRALTLAAAARALMMWQMDGVDQWCNYRGGGDSCPRVQQASGCKTASPKYLWQRNTKESMIKLADRNELLLFWLPTCLRISHYTAQPAFHFWAPCTSQEKIGVQEREHFIAFAPGHEKP